MALTLRQVKGSKLTSTEMDNNLTYLQSIDVPVLKFNNSTTNPSILVYLITASGSFIDTDTKIIHNAFLAQSTGLTELSIPNLVSIGRPHCGPYACWWCSRPAWSCPGGT